MATFSFWKAVAHTRAKVQTIKCVSHSRIHQSLAMYQPLQVPIFLTCKTKLMILLAVLQDDVMHLISRVWAHWGSGSGFPGLLWHLSSFLTKQ